MIQAHLACELSMSLERTLASVLLLKPSWERALEAVSRPVNQGAIARRRERKIAASSGPGTKAHAWYI